MKPCRKSHRIDDASCTVYGRNRALICVPQSWRSTDSDPNVDRSLQLRTTSGEHRGWNICYARDCSGMDSQRNQ